MWADQKPIISQSLGNKRVPFIFSVILHNCIRWSYHDEWSRNHVLCKTQISDVIGIFWSTFPFNAFNGLHTPRQQLACAAFDSKTCHHRFRLWLKANQLRRYMRCWHLSGGNQHQCWYPLAWLCPEALANCRYNSIPAGHNLAGHAPGLKIVPQHAM